MDSSGEVVYGPTGVDAEFLWKQLSRYRIKDAGSVPNYEWVITRLKVRLKENGCERVYECPEDVLPLSYKAEVDVLIPLLKSKKIVGYDVVKK